MPETKERKAEGIDDPSQVPQGDNPSQGSVGEPRPSGSTAASPVPTPTPPPGEEESQSDCESPLQIKVAEQSPPKVLEAAGGSSNVSVDENYQQRFLSVIFEETEDHDRPPPAKLPRSPPFTRDVDDDIVVEPSPGPSRGISEPSAGTSKDLFASCLSSESDPSLTYVLDSYFNATSNYPQDPNRISAPFLPVLGSCPRRGFFEDLLSSISLEPLTFENLESLSSPTASQLPGDNANPPGASGSPRPSPFPGSDWCKERIAKFQSNDSLANALSIKFHQKFNVHLQQERLDYMRKPPFGVNWALWNQAMFLAMANVLARKNEQIWTLFYRFDQLMCSAKWLTGAATQIDLEEVTYTRFLELQKNFFPPHKLMEVEETDDDSDDTEEREPTIRYPICPAKFVFTFPHWKLLTLQLIDMIYSGDVAKIEAVYRRLQQLDPSSPKEK